MWSTSLRLPVRSTPLKPLTEQYERLLFEGHKHDQGTPWLKGRWSRMPSDWSRMPSDECRQGIVSTLESQRGRGSRRKRAKTRARVLNFPFSGFKEGVSH